MGDQRRSTKGYNSARGRQSYDAGNTVAASMIVSSQGKKSEYTSSRGDRVTGMSMMMPATTRNSTSSTALNRSALIPGGGF